MTNRSTTGRWWLAVFPVAAAALLLTAQGLTPRGLDQPIRSLDTARSELSAAASQSGRLYVCTFMIFLGLGCLAVSFPAIGTLCERSRGSTLAVVASVLAGLACLSGIVVNSLVNLNVAGAVRAAAPRDAAAQVVLTTNTTLLPTALLVVYVAGLVVAGILLSIAMWLAHSVPRWLAAAFAPSLILAALAPPGPAGLLLAAPFAAVMITLATRISRPGEQPFHDVHSVSPLVTDRL